MICKHLRKRQLNLKDYFYCAKQKKKIEYSKCFKCKKFEARNYKPINKVGKNKIVVTNETRKRTMQECNNQCKICHKTNYLELHHIIYRSEDKSKINDISNCIMLCAICHKVVHTNKNLWQPILKIIRKEEYINEKGYKFKR